MQGEWYYVKNDTTIGPVSLDELRQVLAIVNAPLMVWREGMHAWLDVREVPEFLSPPQGATAVQPTKLEHGEKKVVLVTGATSGIDKACTEYLSKIGWRVFGTGRSVGQSAVPGEGVEMISMDVDDEQSVKAAVEQVLARAGRLDAVINNAGYSLMGAVEDTSLEEAKAQFETNFFGVLRVCRAAFRSGRVDYPIG
jgi:hypothetical protein